MGLRRRERSTEEEKRRQARIDARAQQDVLAGRAAPASDPPRRTRSTPDRQRVQPAARAVLEAAGVTVDAAGDVTARGQAVGQLVPAWRSARAPLQLRPWQTPAIPKPHRLVAPSWLEVVRMMPCSICGKGRPFVEQLRLGVPQSEVNHYPPRRCGSDFEVHPVCGPSPCGCHGAITDHRPNAAGDLISDEQMALAVAHTLRTMLSAIRDGHVASAILLEAAVEAVIGDPTP